MKKISKIGLIVLMGLMGMVGHAQAQMQAMFGYSKFCLVDKQQPYIETYLQFDAWTMHFAEAPQGGYRAEVEVTIVLRQQDSVCYVKKYDLNSPTVPDLEHLDFSFLDVQRFSVNSGIYTLDITLRDKGADVEPVSLSEKVIVNFVDSQPTLSSMVLMSSIKPTVKENMLSRGGYDMEPYVSDFFPEQVNQLNFYYEIYNIDKYFYHEVFNNGVDMEYRANNRRDEVLTLAYLEELETGRRVSANHAVAKKVSSPTIPVFGSVDISQLPSGNYNLVCEVRDRYDHLLLFSKMPFFRSNPGVKGTEVSEFATTFAGRYSDEELKLYLDALYPVASETEKSVASALVRQSSLEEKQAFLYRFWSKRNPMAPEAEWLKYKERIDYVQEHFSYPMTRGIMTDFGRVYLQYGPPDFIRDEKNFAVVGRSNSIGNEPQTLTTLGNRGIDSGEVGVGQTFYLPYQLWRYNKLPDDDQNRVFLFWDEHRSGYYKLLNSNARGEVQEADWERRLSRQMIPEGEIGEVGRQFNRGY
ncbi:MAG: GWxTD domain-containing protein [Bacteroidales bacterium]|nr:GWxTD domain-containing protein [Bacteroidales bacterium]